jgi:hypothetical protein
MQSRPWYFCGLAGRSPARAARCQRAWRRCRAHQWFAPLVGRQQNGIQRINWLSRAQGTSHTVSFLPQLASRGANEGGLIDQLVHHSLPQFKNDLQNEHKYVAVMPSSGPDDALTPIDQAILGGEQKYTAPIRVPILAIFAVPHNLSDLSTITPRPRPRPWVWSRPRHRSGHLSGATRRYGFFDWPTRTITFSYRIKQTY